MNIFHDDMSTGELIVPKIPMENIDISHQGHSGPSRKGDQDDSQMTEEPMGQDSGQTEKKVTNPQ